MRGRYIALLLLTMKTSGFAFTSTLGSLSNVQQLKSSYFDEQDVDLMEMAVGGRRYEMVELPDSMQVSNLKFVPACVARKPNFSSMKYGFVTFPSIEEKEAAIIRFSGFKLNDRCLRIEEIQDKPNRVRVPEKLVYYVVGEEKRSRDGSKNTLRQASQERSKEVEHPTTFRRRQKPKKAKIPTAASILSSLNDYDKVSFERALRKGYLSISGLYRKNSSLLNAHRIWCSGRDVPQMILSKAHSGRILDKLLVDFSTLSINNLSTDAEVVDDFLTSWKVSLVSAAVVCGMNLRTVVKQNVEEEIMECQHTINLTDEDLDEDRLESNCSTLVFEGPRESAKDMVRQLASLWDRSRDMGEEVSFQDEWDSGSIKRSKGKRKSRN